MSTVAMTAVVMAVVAMSASASVAFPVCSGAS